MSWHSIYSSNACLATWCICRTVIRSRYTALIILISLESYGTNTSFATFFHAFMQYAHLHIKVYLQIVSVLLGVQCHIDGIGRIFLFCLFTLKLWCSSDLLLLTYEVVVSKPTFLSSFAFWDFDSSYIYLHFNRYVSVLQTRCEDLWFPVMKSLIGCFPILCTGKEKSWIIDFRISISLKIPFYQRGHVNFHQRKSVLELISCYFLNIFHTSTLTLVHVNISRFLWYMWLSRFFVICLYRYEAFYIIVLLKGLFFSTLWIVCFSYFMFLCLFYGLCVYKITP